MPPPSTQAKATATFAQARKAPSASQQAKDASFWKKRAEEAELENENLKDRLDERDLEDQEEGRTGRKRVRINGAKKGSPEDDWNKALSAGAKRIVLAHVLFFTSHDACFTVTPTSSKLSTMKLIAPLQRDDEDDGEEEGERDDLRDIESEKEYLDRCKPAAYKGWVKERQEKWDQAKKNAWQELVKLRERFDEVYAGLSDPGNKELLLSGTQVELGEFANAARSTMKQIIKTYISKILTGTFDLDDVEDRKRLLVKHTYSYENCDRTSGTADSKIKRRFVPILRAAQAIFFGPSNIGKLPTEYSRGKATFASITGIKSLSPTIIANIQTMLYATIDHDSFSPPCSKLPPGKAARVGKDAGNLVFESSRYEILSEELRNSFVELFAKEQGVKKLEDLNLALFPPIATAAAYSDENKNALEEVMEEEDWGA